ncbi:hypothetical protein GCM10027185_30290 [Spirosoma pulveris]
MSTPNENIPKYWRYTLNSRVKASVISKLIIKGANILNLGIPKWIITSAKAFTSIALPTPEAR